MLIKQTRDSYAVWNSLITSNRFTEVCFKDSKYETLGEKKDDKTLCATIHPFI